MFSRLKREGGIRFGTVDEGRSDVSGNRLVPASG
jgi:hypothetical protein